MKSCIKFFPAFVLIVYLNACKAQNPDYYAYSIGSYVSTPDGPKILHANRCISYGPYLIEFKMKITYKREVYMLSKKEFRSVEIDTIGLYIMSEINDTYAEFDKFDSAASVIKAGKISEKEFGITFSVPDSAMMKGIFNKNMRDTLINGLPVYVIDSTALNESGETSFLFQFYLVKAKNFNSIYRLNKVVYPDTNYSIVGYHYSYPGLDAATTSSMETMRPLSKEEIAICSALVKKYLAANK